MDADGIWRSFVETGDPVCYLLARKMEQKLRCKNDKKRAEKSPRPSD